MQLTPSGLALLLAAAFALAMPAAAQSPDETGSTTLLQGGVDLAAPVQGDVFSSNGDPVTPDDYAPYPGDIFSSDGGPDEVVPVAPLGDIFGSSGGGGGGGGSWFPGGSGKLPCGMNPFHAEAWKGPAGSYFLGLLSAVIPPCDDVFSSDGDRPRKRPAPPARNPAKMPKVVFNYYFINGINTPVGTADFKVKPGTTDQIVFDPTGAPVRTYQRGRCQFERAVVMQNLLDMRPEIPLRTPFPLGVEPVKVPGETSVMGPLTCNPSGKELIAPNIDVFCQQPGRSNWLSWIPGLGNDNSTVQRRTICNIVHNFAVLADWLRGSGLGMAPGDLLECARQSLNVRGPCPAPPGSPFEQLCQAVQQAQDTIGALSPDMLTLITQMDGMVHQALGALMPVDIEFAARRGTVLQVTDSILATFRAEGGRSYLNDTINFFIVIGHSQGNFFAEGIAYNLQNLAGDDGSYVFAKRLGIVSLASPTAYETLPERFRRERIAHVTREDDMIKVVALGGTLGKRPWPEDHAPPLWPWKPGFTQRTLSDLSLTGAQFGNGVADYKNPNPEIDGALLTPLMNSHLLENYLTNPTASPACQPLNPKVVPDLSRTCPGRPGLSPAGIPIAHLARQRLLAVKQNLMRDLQDDLRYYAGTP